MIISPTKSFKNKTQLTSKILDSALNQCDYKVANQKVIPNRHGQRKSLNKALMQSKQTKGAVTKQNKIQRHSREREY